MELHDIFHIAKYGITLFSFLSLYKVFQFKQTKLKFEYLKKGVWVETDAIFQDAAEGVDKAMFGEPEKSKLREALDKYIRKPATEVLYRTEDGFYTCDFAEKELVDEVRACRTVLYFKESPAVVLTPRQYKFIILRWKITFIRYAIGLAVMGVALAVGLLIK
ncbi:MAG: hypothetical protein QM689_03940 [Oscillospiraceae bacterium]